MKRVDMAGALWFVTFGPCTNDLVVACLTQRIAVFFPRCNSQGTFGWT
jgi:hypothetical protein